MPDYSNVLHDLIARRDRIEQEKTDLDHAIEGLRRLAASAPDADHAKGTTFAGLSMPDALKVCLKGLGSPADKARIKEALLAGGMPKTKDFGAKVYNTLYRLKGASDPFYQKDGRWGLREWLKAPAENGARKRR